MNERYLFQGKSITGEWLIGNLIEVDNGYYIFSKNAMNSYDRYEVLPETICRCTGKHLAKGNKVFEGTIAFHEVELDEGDERTYLVCVWLDEWSMFAWLTIGEYIKYQDMGSEALDEQSFWTYTLEDSEQYHYAGNIYDNPELIIQ